MIIETISAQTGVKENRVRDVFRALREAEMLPSGGPGVAPELDVRDAIKLMVAVSSGATLETVADRARDILRTTPGGAVLTDAPANIPKTAEIELATLASLAIDGYDASGLVIEICTTWPEIVLSWNNGLVQRFQSPGTVSGHPESMARWAVRIPGAAFAAIVRTAA